LEKLHGEDLEIYVDIMMVISKKNRFRWTGHVARNVEDRPGFQILSGEPRGK
jgi:hypothetical protein